MNGLDKQTFESDFYVYRLSCEEHGVYYIGSHFCTGRSSSCSAKRCNYLHKSHGARKLERLYPDSEWTHEIISWAESREELAAQEVSLLQSHVGRDGCLNEIVASPTRTPTYTQKSLEAIRGAAKRKTITLKLPSGELQEFKRHEISSAILRGYTFRHSNISLVNHERRQFGRFSSVTVCRIWSHLEEHDWEFGHCGEYECLSVSQLLESLDLIKEVKVVSLVTYRKKG